jgi:hypothetical protein
MIFIADIGPLQCWIPEHKHLGWKIGAEYLFYWTSALCSLLTALLYLVSARLGRQLLGGYFWIGFQTRQNNLFQIGILSERASFGRILKSGYSLSDVTWNGRNRSILYINHLVPPHDHESLAVSRLSGHSTGNLSNNEDCDLPDSQSTPMKDAIKLLLSVSQHPNIDLWCSS